MTPHLSNESVFEAVEPRRLLSVTLLPNGILLLAGTGSADQFNIGQSSSSIAVQEVGVHPLLVFNAEQVNLVVAALLGGGDGLNTGLGFGQHPIPTLPEFESLLKPLQVNAGTGNDTVYSGAGIADDTVNGGPGDDLLINILGADVIHGNDGDDKIFTQNGDEAIFGDGGNDIINTVDPDNPFPGSSLAGLVHGGEGNDLIGAQGSATPDLIRSYYGDGGDDMILGSANGAGNAYIDGGSGDDVLVSPQSRTGFDTHVTLIGGSGDDQITGSDDADFIVAGAGDDAVDAGGGRDTVYGAAGNDSVSAGDGNDHVFGGTGNDRINGGAGRDVLYGGAGNDLIFGGDDDDDLFGDAGNDTLRGENGVDILIGGSGTDDELP